MVQTQVYIEVLNFAFNFSYNLRPMEHQTLDTSIANNLCWFWLQMNGTGVLILAVAKIFQTEKSLREFSFSSISSLDILAFYI